MRVLVFILSFFIWANSAILLALSIVAAEALGILLGLAGMVGAIWVTALLRQGHYRTKKWR